MEIKQGIAVSPGVAIGSPLVIQDQAVHIPRRQVDPSQLTQEAEQLTQAIDLAYQDIEQLRDQVESSLGQEAAAIFSFHLGMLKDRHLTDQIYALIEKEHVTAAHAVTVIMRQFADLFTKQTNKVFQERVSDIWDLERRILHHLLGHACPMLAELNEEVILIAHDLTPSQTASLDPRWVKGIATNVGGRTSHTAIIAKSLRIPAVIGLENITQVVGNDDTVIIDGDRGLVLTNPDAKDLQHYTQQRKQITIRDEALSHLVDLPAMTTDGVTITLSSNVEFNREIPIAQACGSQGIGLYRTEYLFLSHETDPDEERQYQVYKEAVEQQNGQRLTFRTLDLGADKYTQQHAHLEEANPFLGCRSIRFCLKNLTLFKTHLRALLRASAHGPTRIMFPLISNMTELRQARMIVRDVMEDLTDDHLPFDPALPIGMMIEVPATAIMARQFINEVDFFSIGTNDLIQYTVAVDRANEHVANLYSSAHPAVIKLIKKVADVANRKSLDVSCCGEMAGDPLFIIPLIGLGLRHLSMTPHAIPMAKQIIRSIAMTDAQRVARRIATYDTEQQIQNYLRKELHKILPDIMEA